MGDSLETLAERLRIDLADDRCEVEDSADAPRYELFHAANSICSQKVRAVFAELAVPYTPRAVSIFAGQTYLPNYVRLRMIGCLRLSPRLASAHGGSTSVATGGCDAAVVPTLIDWRTDEVVVDSKRICLYLDERGVEPHRLRPRRVFAEIDAELAIVDELPNYQMLMGTPPSGASTPVTRRGGGGPGFSLSKVERCERYLEQFADDPELGPAYRAKLDKELDAANHLFSAEAMCKAYAAAEAACGRLEQRLEARRSTWLFEDQPSMADLFWGVELLRMKNLGADAFWIEDKLPQVAAYVAALEALPSIKTAVLDWPGSQF